MKNKALAAHSNLVAVAVAALLMSPLWLPCSGSSECAAQNDRAQLREELNLLSDSLGRDPDNTALRMRKAACNLQLEEWQYAKSEYDYILDRDPSNSTALFYRAFANTKIGRHGFARADYEALLAIVPNHFEGQLGLALLNQKDKRYVEAMDQINILIEQNPESAIAYAARGGMEKERGMIELAEYDFTQAISLDPENKDYILNRADLRIKMGKYEDAKDDLDRLVELGTQRAALTEFYGRLGR